MNNRIPLYLTVTPHPTADRPPVVRQYPLIEHAPPKIRAQFAWMLAHGVSSVRLGQTVVSIH